MKHFFAANFLKLLLPGILIGLFSGCSVINPAEEVPSYLHIDAISLNAVGNQGSSTSKITDAWIFMDGNLLGGFELPCNVPILAEGNHQFVIKGGVKMNGVSTTRAIYPSWKGWEGTVSLSRGQKTTINPVVTYFSGIDFSGNWMLNFDQSGNSLIPEANSSGTIIVSDSASGYEGKSGYIHLNNNDTTFFVGSSSTGYIMPPTVDTWLEFDFKSDAVFTVGIEETVNTFHRIAWLQVQPNSSWTKIYIRLTDALTQAATESPSPASVPYKIYFAFANPSSQSESYLYLDNIKLLK